MLKELQRPAKPVTIINEEKAQKFIAQGGSIAATPIESSGDHRLTLRIPKWMIDKIDVKRKERVGAISRNLWILEQLERACKK